MVVVFLYVKWVKRLRHVNIFRRFDDPHGHDRYLLWCNPRY